MHESGSAFDEELLSEWKEAVTVRPDGPFRQVILRSWSRSQAVGLDAGAGALRLRRVPRRELRARQREHADLIEAATPDLRRVSSALEEVPHVVYLVDRDGVVLASEGNDPRMMEEYGLTPGHDWSEAAMGTNGAGTALAEGAPVVVFGPDHFVEPLKGFVCTGAPLHDGEGRIVGAVDVSTGLEHGGPTNLLLAARAAAAIERTMGWRGRDGTPEPGEPEPPAGRESRQAT